MGDKMTKEILILSVTKTKSGKSILEYGVPTVGNSDYRKGMLVLQDWRDDEYWFSKVNDSLIGKKVVCETELKRLKNNHLVEKIISIRG